MHQNSSICHNLQNKLQVDEILNFLYFESMAWKNVLVNIQLFHIKIKIYSTSNVKVKKEQYSPISFIHTCYLFLLYQNSSKFASNYIKFTFNMPCFHNETFKVWIYFLVFMLKILYLKFEFWMKVIIGLLFHTRTQMSHWLFFKCIDFLIIDETWN
jgi:hypothetical protein